MGVYDKSLNEAAEAHHRASKAIAVRKRATVSQIQEVSFGCRKKFLVFRDFLRKGRKIRIEVYLS